MAVVVVMSQKVPPRVLGAGSDLRIADPEGWFVVSVNLSDDTNHRLSDRCPLCAAKAQHRHRYFTPKFSMHPNDTTAAPADAP